KPLKYPTLIHTADSVVVSKMDLAAAVGFDLKAAMNNIQAARPGVETLQLSARSGEGLELWIDHLKQRCAEKRDTRLRFSTAHA
ncbi:MAG TPA: hypothetical protein VGH32_07155, partial [Pirellulales bacterium]